MSASTSSYGAERDPDSQQSLLQHQEVQIPVAEEYEYANDLECGGGARAGAAEVFFTKNANLDVTLRHGFIRKVLGILFAQLFVTFGCISLVALCKPIRNYIANEETKELHLWPMYVGYALIIGSFVAMFCIGDNLRRHPTNLIFLSIFTVGEALSLSILGVVYSSSTVLEAIGITLCVLLVLVAFSMQTKHDFTGFAPYALVCLVVLLSFGFIAAISNSETVNIMYGAAGCLLFSMFIVYDVQLIVGGERTRFQFGLDDYVLAAITLYMDIINLFLFILRIIGSADR